MSLRLSNGLMAGLAMAVLLGGCASAPAADAGTDAAMATTTFFVVRHAEKAGGGSDPSLSPAGQARAQMLARHVGQPLRAAYATAYRRTQETALPAAQAQGVAVTTYDANMPAPDFAAQLRRDHVGDQVLVVGHSNTAPQIAAALCGCEVAPMADSEFNRLMKITVERDGRATLREERY